MHGGPTFRAPVLIDDRVVEGIAAASELAPLHNRPALEAIPNLERDTAADVEFWGWGFRGPTALQTTWEV